MKKIILLGVVLFGLQACSAHQGREVGKILIQGYNLGKNINGITKDGVKEEASNCIKDIFDPSNRVSQCG